MKEVEILNELKVNLKDDVLFDYDVAQIIKYNVPMGHMQDDRITPKPSHEENIKRITKALRDAIKDEINFTYDPKYKMVRCKIGRNDNEKSLKKNQFNFNEYQWTINLNEELEIDKLFTYYDNRPSWTRPYSLDGIDNFLKDILLVTSSDDITKNMAQQFFKQYIISVIEKNKEIVNILEKEEIERQKEEILKKRKKIQEDPDLSDEEKKEEIERFEKLTDAKKLEKISDEENMYEDEEEDEEEKRTRKHNEEADLDRMKSIKYKLYKILLNGKYTIKFVESTTSDGKSRRRYKTKSTKKSKSRRRYKTKSKSRKKRSHK